MDKIIGIIVMLIVLMIFCIVSGIDHFKRIYPTRYGKKHIELDAKIVGVERVMARSGSLKCPVLEFDYQNNKYKIIDSTFVLWDEKKIGRFVKICFNPEQNDKIAIIKRGKYNFRTLIWLSDFIIGLLCLITVLVCCVWLKKTY